MRKLFTPALVIGLLVSMAAFNWSFGQSLEKTADANKTVMGKVTKVDDTSLTIESKGSSSSDSTTSHTFVLNEQTTKPNNVTVGSEVTIEYKEQGDSKVATRITVRPVATPP